MLMPPPCVRLLTAVLWLGLLPPGGLQAQSPDLILHNAKVVTVDDQFTVHEAMAIEGERIVAVGSNAEVLKLAGEKTKRRDLNGKMVMPGIIDSHTHPSGASMFEFDHEVPVMETIDDVLAYVKSRTQAVDPGTWIWVSQVFITRLKEQRYPTRAELDRVAPEHPVVFRTGPDASLNSLALELSGIDKDFQVVGSGKIERDPATGEPTGILRACRRYIKSGDQGLRSASEAQRVDRLAMLFADYNSVGITAIADRGASDSSLRRCSQLLDSDRLTVRVAASWYLGTDGSMKSVREKIKEVARHPLVKGTPKLKIVGIKTYLDGGMLTGSAYMRKPWGLSQIYSIDDPRYRGVRFIEQERLVEVVRATVENDLQFTSHSVGDAAVHALIDAYATVAQEIPIQKTRPCITHCNFMSLEAIEQMAGLEIVADIQPAWLYLDTRTLTAQFDDERLRYFQPLKTLFEHEVIVGGGSDHMQKIGSLRSVNPYNPFLGMATTITRRAKWYEGQLHAEEALSREQAIRFYTSNNAYICFLDDQVGTLEAGKRADFIVLDRDLLTCPAEQIADTQVLATYLDGKQVYASE